MRGSRLVLVTAIGPMLWGTNYLATTELLPPDRPLLASAVRALPAGILLLLLVSLRTKQFALPRGSWWWQAAVLGSLNIGLFFVCFFVGAYRLPGGIAAVLGAFGPFLVAGLAYLMLGVRLTRRVLTAAMIGLAGVALLVLRSSVSLDTLGLVAAAGGVITMSLGTVLGRRWGLPPLSARTGSAPAVSAGGAPPASRVDAVLALTAWQLIAGGLLVAPVALAVEGAPPAISGVNLLGFAYLALIGTAVAHFLWFRGVNSIAPTPVTVLTLLSPVVAMILGWVVLGQALTAGQTVGAVAVLSAVVLSARAATPRPAPTATRSTPSAALVSEALSGRATRWIPRPAAVYSGSSSPDPAPAAGRCQ
jgi:probable blue pigment (indigoidine) exporter